MYTRALVAWQARDSLVTQRSRWPALCPVPACRSAREVRRRVGERLELRWVRTRKLWRATSNPSSAPLARQSLHTSRSRRRSRRQRSSWTARGQASLAGGQGPARTRRTTTRTARLRRSEKREEDSHQAPVSLECGGTRLACGWRACGRRGYIVKACKMKKLKVCMQYRLSAW